jgi:hypothetical protein
MPQKRGESVFVVGPGERHQIVSVVIETRTAAKKRGSSLPSLVLIVENILKRFECAWRWWLDGYKCTFQE